MDKLPVSLIWVQGLLLISGAFFVVLYQAGWALSEIGSWSLLVWAAVTVVGLIQAYMLYRLAKAYPKKAGGTAVYTLELFSGRARVLAFLSGWGYWLAWTPATALNSYLCGLVINQMLGSTFNPTLLAMGVMALLYALNWFGLSRVLASSYVLALVVLVPLGVLVWLALQTFTPQKLDLTLDFSVPVDWITLLKWFFVIAWIGYGLEMISSVVAETKGHSAKPLFVLAACWSVVAFVGIPMLLVLLTDRSTQNSDPFVMLQPYFAKALGPAGEALLYVFLIAALLYSALAILVPSTRTIYQMSRDGLIPPYFASVNRFGTPQGSLVLDIILNVGLLLIFGASLVSILAVANVGYMVVFVLLPTAYALFLRQSGPLTMPQWLLVGGLWGLNTLVLLVGGAAWGSFVFGVGSLLVGLGIPLYFLSRRASAIPHSKADLTR